MRQTGRFGEYGGMYVPEILFPALEQLEEAFLAAEHDPTFQTALQQLLTTYAGRPSTPLAPPGTLREPNLQPSCRRK